MIQFPLPAFMKRSGFALLEALVVIGILGIVSGVTIPLYRDYQIRSDLSLASEQVAQGLARAKLLAESAKEDSAWGFYIPSGTLFKGPSYAERDPLHDEVYAMPSTITTTGLLQVSYSKVEGTPSATGAITLTGLRSEERTVLLAVETESVAIVDSDEITICHIPPGNPANAHSITISDSAWPAHQGHGDTLGPCPGEASSSTSSSVPSSLSSSAVSSAGGGAQGGSSSAATCQDRFSIALDGTITTTGPLDVTFTVLGSAITWGAGGPEIAVTVQRKKTSGSGWSDLFSGNDVDGGETQTVTGYTNGTQVVARINGYYRQSRWLTFDATYDSNDQSGHTIILRDGDALPAYPAFADQESLETYLQNILDAEGHVDIGTYDLVLLTELGALDTSSADFQDAVLLIRFSQPAC